MTVWEVLLISCKTKTDAVHKHWRFWARR